MSMRRHTTRAAALLAMIALAGCNLGGPVRDHADPISPDQLPQGPKVDLTPPPKQEEVDEISALLTRARQEVAAGRLTDAEITLWQVRHREALHLEANELYQDVRLKSRTKAQVYAEYRPLLAENPNSLAALYLALRPMVTSWRAPQPTGRNPTVVRARADEYRGPFPDGPRVTATDSNPAATSAYMHARTLLREAKPQQAIDALAGIPTENPPWVLAEMLRQDAWLEIHTGQRAPAAPLYPASAPAEGWTDLLANARRILNTGDGIGDSRAIYERLARIVEPEQASLRLATDILGGFSSWWGVATLAEIACQRALAAEGDERTAGCRLAILLADACILTIAVNDHSPWLSRGLSMRALGRATEAAADLQLASNLAAGHDPRTARALAGG